MKKTITLTTIASVFILFLAGCKSEKSNPVETKTPQLPDGMSGYFSIKCEYLSTPYFRTQTSMLTGYNGKLYRFGTLSPVQVWDLVTNSWSEIALPNSTFARWDGAAATIGDSIFVVAVYYNSSYDILVFDASKNTFQHTDVNLPKTFSHPAYCTYQDKIVFLTPKEDSIFEYNTTNRSLRLVAINPFQGSVYYYNRMASGKHSNYFYVLGGYSYLPENKFIRLNLDNYTWEGLTMPALLKQKMLFGFSFGNQFVLFCDSVSTYQYSFADSKWYMDTAKVPIFPRYLTGELYQGEWSFFGNDSSLYATDNDESLLWKITE